MDLKEELREYFGDCKKLTVYRTFTQLPADRTVVKITNDIIKNEDETTAITAIALMILPIIRWTVKNMPRLSDVDKFIGDTEVSKMEDLQKLLVCVGGETPRIHLKNREVFRNKCKVYVSKMEDYIFELRGREKNSLLQTLDKMFGEDKDDTPSRYMIRRFYEEGVKCIAQFHGDEIAKMLMELAPPATSEDYESGALLLHNGSILIREYRKIISGDESSKSFSSKLQKCKTIEDVERAIPSPEMCESAYAVYEYMKLIRMAAIAVDGFWSEEKYGKILEMLMSENMYKDIDIAIELLVSERTLSRQKKTACSLMGILLWGCDARAFFELLTTPYEATAKTTSSEEDKVETE